MLEHESHAPSAPEAGRMHETEKREVEGLDAAPEIRWLRARYPVFDGVRFETEEDPALEGGLFDLPESEDDKPTVRIALGGPERFAALRDTRREAVEAMATELGLPFDSLDGQAIREFILLHEAGHAYDFLQNFRGSDSDTSVEDAVAEWRDNSRAQLGSLPFPHAAPAELREEIAEAGGFAAWRDADAANNAWCVAHAVSSERELLRIQEAAYRALDKERYADRFAAQAFLERRSTAPGADRTAH